MDAQLREDESAVSPVIGVILMVAMTVILSAVLGTFALGFGDSANEPSHRQIEFDYDANADEVVVRHGGGEPFTPGNTDCLLFRGDASTDEMDFDEWGAKFNPNDLDCGREDGAKPKEPIGVGDLIYDSASDNANGDFDSGFEIKIIWQPAGGDSDQIIATWQAP